MLIFGGSGRNVEEGQRASAFHLHLCLSSPSVFDLISVMIEGRKLDAGPGTTIPWGLSRVPPGGCWFPQTPALWLKAKVCVECHLHREGAAPTEKLYLNSEDDETYKEEEGADFDRLPQCL